MSANKDLQSSPSQRLVKRRRKTEVPIPKRCALSATPENITRSELMVCINVIYLHSCVVVTRTYVFVFFCE